MESFSGPDCRRHTEELTKNPETSLRRTTSEEEITQRMKEDASERRSAPDYFL